MWTAMWRAFLALWVLGVDGAATDACTDECEESAWIQVHSRTFKCKEAEYKCKTELKNCEDWKFYCFIDGAADNLQTTAENLVNLLPNVSNWINQSDEGFEGPFIDDGVNDMWDDGNFLAVHVFNQGIFGALNYTQQCNGDFTKVPGAIGVDYFTCRLDVQSTIANAASPNGTVWFAGFRAAQPIINGLSITGELGADGSGLTQSGKVKRLDLGGLFGYYSQKIDTGDPSINQLVITPDPTMINFREAFNVPEEAHNLENDIVLRSDGGKPVSFLLYILWGGGDNFNQVYSKQEFQSVLKAVKFW